jgi:hypothetical protein
MVTLRSCAVTDSMSCGGEIVMGKKECAAYVGRLEGNLASLSPGGAREDTVGTKALVAETSKNGPFKANSGRCE